MTFPWRFRWTCLLAFSLTAWAQQPCDCIDKADLKERLARVKNAIKAYGDEITQIGRTPYTAVGRKALQARVDQAVSGQRRQGIKLGADGHTSNLCQIEVTAPTRCLEEAIRRHEKVHQDACKQTLETHLKKILAGEAADRFEANGNTMAGYIMEELQGYQAEIAFLQGELNRLERDCQPPPAPKRDYSSPLRSDRPDAPAPAQGPAPVGKPKPITAPPLAKPKPLPQPAPLK